jgi:hypothetical protein
MRRSDMRQDKTRTHVSNLLYRGQSNAQWRLSTTLERYIGSRASLEDYYRKIFIAKAQIQTFTKTKWDIPKLDEYREWLNKVDFFYNPEIPAFEYMAYLRHPVFLHHCLIGQNHLSLLLISLFVISQKK